MSAVPQADVEIRINNGSAPASGTNTFSNSVNSSNSTSNTEGGGGGGNRVGAATLPTTSTQTRSTTRPHIAPPMRNNIRPIPANMLSSFDRFLPCNSHHVPENSHQAHQQQGQGQGQGQRQQTANRGEQSPEDAMQNLSHDEISTPLNLFGSQLTLRDFINVTPTATTLNRIRDDLNTFIRMNFFSGRHISDTLMEEAVNECISSLQPYFVHLPYPPYEHPHFDVRGSIEQLIRHSVPGIFSLVQEDPSDEFGIRLLRQLIGFTRRFFSILIVTSGRQNAEEYLNRAIQMTIPASLSPLQIFQRFIQSAITSALSAIVIDHQDVNQFVVRRLPPPPSPQAAVAPKVEQATPMETDEPVGAASGSSTEATSASRVKVEATPIKTELRESISTPPLIERPVGDLPEVTPGSEAWHAHFPTQWLPVITRDIELQRNDKVGCERFVISRLWYTLVWVLSSIFGTP